jgi:hypothetical protein
MTCYVDSLTFFFTLPITPGVIISLSVYGQVHDYVPIEQYDGIYDSVTFNTDSC